MNPSQHQEILNKLNVIENALVGNELTKDGGLIAEVKELKTQTMVNSQFISRLKWTGSLFVGVAAFFGYLADKLIEIFTKH